MSFMLVFSQQSGPLDDTSLTRSQFSLNLCQHPLHNEHTRHSLHRVHSSTQKHFIRHLKLKTTENNQTISNMILNVSLNFDKFIDYLNLNKSRLLFSSAEMFGLNIILLRYLHIYMNTMTLYSGSDSKL